MPIPVKAELSAPERETSGGGFPAKVPPEWVGRAWLWLSGAAGKRVLLCPRQVVYLGAHEMQAPQCRAALSLLFLRRWGRVAGSLSGGITVPLTRLRTRVGTFTALTFQILKG